MKANYTKHGDRKSPEYQAWAAIIQRCCNPNNPNYRHYGGRGITVCEQWRVSYPTFLADMGRRPDGMTIDRIDDNGNYEPGNDRWATWVEQNNNQRNTRFITYQGKTKSLATWSRELKIPPSTIWMRIKREWPEDRLLTLAR